MRALFSSLVAIRRFLMFLLNAKQMGLVYCLCGQGVRDGVVSDTLPSCGTPRTRARTSAGGAAAAGGSRATNLFAECRAWTQIRRLWRRVGKDCGWKHLRAPSVRWLWRVDATEAVLEFLGDTNVGCRSSGVARVERDEAESVRQESECEEGPGPP